MPIYELRCRGRELGRESDQVFEADNEADALRKAADLGYQVLAVRAAPPARVRVVGEVPTVVPWARGRAFAGVASWLSWVSLVLMLPTAGELSWAICTVLSKNPYVGYLNPLLLSNGVCVAWLGTWAWILSAVAMELSEGTLGRRQLQMARVATLTVPCLFVLLIALMAARRWSGR
ncbi:MAG: hypothetical protein KIT68_07150 [Phycisphaeraceae bacterium]|nr:hypothetical protein [Phycisphaeraceae bacterium]